MPGEKVEVAPESALAEEWGEPDADGGDGEGALAEEPVGPVEDGTAGGVGGWASPGDEWLQESGGGAANSEDCMEVESVILEREGCFLAETGLEDETLSSQVWVQSLKLPACTKTRINATTCSRTEAIMRSRWSWNQTGRPQSLVPGYIGLK